jgi:hypothetical protein
VVPIYQLLIYRRKKKLSQKFFWFEMREDINIWIQQCEICGAIKPPAKASSHNFCPDLNE